MGSYPPSRLAVIVTPNSPLLRDRLTCLGRIRQFYLREHRKTRDAVPAIPAVRSIGSSSTIEVIGASCGADRQVADIMLFALNKSLKLSVVVSRVPTRESSPTELS
jgi:hypothetical protein